MAKSQSPVALVTGAASGIGRAIALKLLFDGWSVAALDLPQGGHRRRYARNRRALAIDADVADPAAVERAVRAVIRRFGRLDAVVSNAGIMKRTTIAKLKPADWHRVLDVNLTATYLLARAAEKALRRSKGAIVTIASTRALMSEPDTEAYAASKGGLVALSHALSISLGPDVRVNCISPGWIETGSYRKLRARDHTQHPAGRVGKPEDIAEIVSFLVDGTRSGFVTGANFVIDGGMTRKMIYVE
ncbi:MAG: SDR family oxidoreductase [Pseudorhodoplanes sp.]|nr:SDR family oxidoreductase [Pseudorhodoplanes sp.]